MSKLFGLFGKKKKNKNQLTTNLLNKNTEVVSQVPESGRPNTAPKFIIQDVDYCDDDSENWPQPRLICTANKQGLQKVNLVHKSPSNRMSYIHGNESNRPVVTQYKALDKTFGPQNVENISEDISIKQLKTSEKENFTPDAKENCLMAQIEAPTRNSFKLIPHDTEISNLNGPGAYVVLRENKIQRRSRNLGEYVNNIPYRRKKALETVTNDGWELRDLKETGPNRLSLKYGEQTRRVSVLVPLELEGQESGSRRATGILDPMTGLVSEVQPRKLSVVKPVAQVEEGLRYSVLNPEVMKPVRRSVMNPMMGVEPNKQARYSTLNPIVINENARPARLSVSRPLSQNERFPLSTQQPVVYAVRRGNNESENQQSTFYKKLFTRNRDVEQTVCDVPTVPTRGRTGSILQQSVKSLTSQKEETPVFRKNIRYSVDTDVFSADVRRRMPNPTTPGYVNMERGQGMLVSELLNPITSIFISDLKDPVPKDPNMKPREANIWVRPRQYSMREVVTPNPPHKQNKRVQISVAPVAAATKIQSKSKQVRNRRYMSEDESSSSASGESSESIDSRERYPTNRKPTHHRVYATTVPTVNLPDLIREVDDTSSSGQGNTNLVTGTTLVQPYINTNVLNKDTQERRQSKLVQPPNVRRLSVVEQTDIEEAVDYLCNPPEDIAKNQPEL